MKRLHGSAWKAVLNHFDGRFLRLRALATWAKWKAHLSRILIGSGVTALAVPWVYGVVVGDVSLSFIKPFGRYHVFEIANHTPVDQIVEKFRVSVPPGQPFLGVVTQAIRAETSDIGIRLPGGNTSWIPAVEFTELDGQLLAANEEFKFRLPPLSSKNYLISQVMIIDVAYSFAPANWFLSGVDRVLKTIGLRNSSTETRYLVVDNYLIPTRSKSLTEALRIACRDDDSLSSMSECQGWAPQR